MKDMRHLYESIPAAVKDIADVTSVGLAVGTLTQHLPDIAAILSIAWGIVRFYEYFRNGKIG